MKRSEKNLKLFERKGLTNRDWSVILVKLSGGTGVRQRTARKRFGKAEEKA